MKPEIADGKYSIATTGFHFDEVKKIIGHLPVKIYVLITNMSRETRRKPAAFDNDTKYGFVSGNEHIAALVMDILKEDLGDVNIQYCSIKNKREVKNLVKNVNAVLAPPSVYKEVMDLVAPDFPVIEVFDIVDPMSLKLFKDQIFSEYEVCINPHNNRSNKHFKLNCWVCRANISVNFPDPAASAPFRIIADSRRRNEKNGCRIMLNNAEMRTPTHYLAFENLSDCGGQVIAAEDLCCE